MDERGAAVVLADDVEIGLVHPLDLAEARRAAFGVALSDEWILQPFLQLARETLPLDEAQRDATAVTRWVGQEVRAEHIYRLKRRGGSRGPIGPSATLPFSQREVLPGLVARLCFDDVMFSSGRNATACSRSARCRSCATASPWCSAPSIR